MFTGLGAVDALNIDRNSTVGDRSAITFSYETSCAVDINSLYCTCHAKVFKCRINHIHERSHVSQLTGTVVYCYCVAIPVKMPTEPALCVNLSFNISFQAVIQSVTHIVTLSAKITPFFFVIYPVRIILCS